MGQTQIARPEVILPTVVSRLRHVTDFELRSRLFTALLALLPEEEMITMVERLLEHEDLVMELPYLRRIREEGRQEGRQEGARKAARKVARKAARKAGVRVRRRCCSGYCASVSGPCRGHRSTHPGGRPRDTLALE